jgi:hypothetical protein
MFSEDQTEVPELGEAPTPASRWHWWILVIPTVWCVFLIPLVNKVGYVFGNVPFLLVWMIGGVIVGSLCIFIVYRIDRSRGQLEVM